MVKGFSYRMVQKNLDSGGRRRGRPRGFDPDTALGRAVGVFWAKGYDGASMAELTAATGLSKPSLYAAFGDKEALFASAIERYGATVYEPAVAAFEAEGDIRAGARALMDGARGLALGAGTADACPRGCLLFSAAATVAPALEGVGPRVSAILDAMAGRLAARLARAVEDGSLAPVPPPETRALMLVDAMSGQAIRARLGVPADRLAAEAEASLSVVLT